MGLWGQTFDYSYYLIIIARFSKDEDFREPSAVTSISVITFIILLTEPLLQQSESLIISATLPTIPQPSSSIAKPISYEDALSRPNKS